MSLKVTTVSFKNSRTLSVSVNLVVIIIWKDF